MDPTILRGHSIQQIDGSTVIIDHLGHHWHTFEGVVPMEAAKAVAEAYRAGYAAGRSDPRLANAVKDIAGLANAAVARL